MRRLLLINPNTSTDITAFMAQRLRPQLPAGAELVARTAAFGAPYISCEASSAVAAHAVLHGWAHEMASATAKGPAAAAPDAVLIGCFGDPGLLALRENSAVPVTGLAEASFIEGARLGAFAIVTGGLRWKPMLERLAQTLGYGTALVHIETVLPTGAELRADAALARQHLGQACQQAARHGAKTIIIGGAGLAGMAQQLQTLSPLPLIDSLDAGLRVLLQGQAPPAPTLQAEQARAAYERVHEMVHVLPGSRPSLVQGGTG
jgi:allantoin racemase